MFVNSEDPDEMSCNVTFHQGLHSVCKDKNDLQRKKIKNVFSERTDYHSVCIDYYSVSSDCNVCTQIIISCLRIVISFVWIITIYILCTISLAILTSFGYHLLRKKRPISKFTHL